MSRKFATLKTGALREIRAWLHHCKSLAACLLLSTIGIASVFVEGVNEILGDGQMLLERKGANVGDEQRGKFY